VPGLCNLRAKQSKVLLALPSLISGNCIIYKVRTMKRTEHQNSTGNCIKFWSFWFQVRGFPALCISDPGSGCQVLGMKIICIIFCVNYLYYLRKRNTDARFLGVRVYPKAGESNFLPLTKIKILSSITQLVFTSKSKNTDVNNSVSRNLTPCGLAHYYQLVGRACCLHLYSLTVLKTKSKAST